MGRIIAVEPTFCEAPFLRAHIKNICDYIKPDIFIIAEGMFPLGPESTVLDEHQKKFIEKYTLDGKRGFDWESVKNICEECAELYPDIDIQLVSMDYAPNTATPIAYYQVFTHFLDDVKIQPDDIIMPLESDIFYTEEIAVEALKAVNELSEGQGIGTTYRNIFENPKYVSNNAAGRKLAFRYGDGETYHTVMKYFFWEKEYIPYLSHIYDFKLFHYAWMRPQGIYWQLRQDQIFTPSNTCDHMKASTMRAFELFREDPPDLQLSLDVEVNIVGGYPNFQIESIEYNEHPKHIRKHPNFIKFYGEK